MCLFGQDTHCISPVWRFILLCKTLNVPYHTLFNGYVLDIRAIYQSNSFCAVRGDSWIAVAHTLRADRGW